LIWSRNDSVVIFSSSYSLENPDGIAWTPADFVKSARQSANAVAQFEVGDAPNIAIDNFLARRLSKAARAAVV
jgi:hypothetical protein